MLYWSRRSGGNKWESCDVWVSTDPQWWIYVNFVPSHLDHRDHWCGLADLKHAVSCLLSGCNRFFHTSKVECVSIMCYARFRVMCALSTHGVSSQFLPLSSFSINMVINQYLKGKSILNDLLADLYKQHAIFNGIQHLVDIFLCFSSFHWHVGLSLLWLLVWIFHISHNAVWSPANSGTSYPLQPYPLALPLYLCTLSVR